MIRTTLTTILAASVLMPGTAVAAEPEDVVRRASAAIRTLKTLSYDFVYEGESGPREFHG